MRSRIPLLLIVSALLSLLGFGVLAQKATDRVIKRDGSSVTGHLDSVDEANVTIDGNAIPRSDVKAILFAGTKTATGPAQSSSNTQPSGTNQTDLVVKRIGGNSYGHVSQVTKSVVIQNGTQLSRTSVASIAFNVNNPGQIIIVTSEPSPSPSPGASPSPSASSSPSPSPSPGSGGGGESAGGGSNDQPSGGAGGGSRVGDRPPPPWLGDCGDNAERSKIVMKEGHFVGETTKKGQPVACRLTVSYCGHWFSREQIVRDNKAGACDEAYEQLGKALGAGTKICCDKLEQARKTKKPCDPAIDLDCDGVPNQDDGFPFDPNRSRDPSRKISN